VFFCRWGWSRGEESPRRWLGAALFSDNCEAKLKADKGDEKKGTSSKVTHSCAKRNYRGGNKVQVKGFPSCAESPSKVRRLKKSDYVPES
jgi:hypothetical protein